MLVIVEGIDRVGKTTLCEKLSEKLNVPIYKHKNEQFNYSKMDNENETDKMLQLLDMYSILDGDVIFDRFHLSDFVYGTIERKYDLIKSEENVKKIEEKLKELNAILVLIVPTNVKESSEKHGKNLIEYAVTFENLFNESKIKKLKCNFYSLDEAVEFIFVEKEKQNGRL